MAKLYFFKNNNKRDALKAVINVASQIIASVIRVMSSTGSNNYFNKFMLYLNKD